MDCYSSPLYCYGECQRKGGGGGGPRVGGVLSYPRAQHEQHKPGTIAMKNIMMQRTANENAACIRRICFLGYAPMLLR